MSNSLKKFKDTIFYKAISNIVIPFVVVSIICYVVLKFFPITNVTGDSMLPSFHNSQKVIGTSHYTLKRGDVIVAKIEISDDDNSTKVYADIIKRVIAMSGDKIEIKYNTKTNEKGDVVATNCTVFVNDVQLIEPYILCAENYNNYYDSEYTDDLTKAMNIFEGNIEYPLIVPDGKIFVMGDNRNNSNDSRGSVGLIDVSSVKSKVITKK